VRLSAACRQLAAGVAALLATGGGSGCVDGGASTAQPAAGADISGETRSETRAEDADADGSGETRSETSSNHVRSEARDGEERDGDAGTWDASKLPSLPLAVEGRFVVDAAGNRVRLFSVNWNGAHEEGFVPTGLDMQPLQAIAVRIRDLGFNSVRLTWSNEMVESNPVVAPERVEANPDLAGLHAMDVFDAAVGALADAGLLVILNNHMSNAGWCCSLDDGNSLWYNDDYPESAWIEDWVFLAERYGGTPAVIGADLRNEPRLPAVWSDAFGAQVDWPSAAERCGNAVLAIKPDWLIFVEGVSFASDLSGVANRPIELFVPGRLVYSAHDYPWFHETERTPEELQADLLDSWAYLMAGSADAPPAPVWVGEFGTCNTCLAEPWFDAFLGFVEEMEIDTGWWLLYGDGSWGLLDPATNQLWNPDLLERLRQSAGL